MGHRFFMILVFMLFHLKVFQQVSSHPFNFFSSCIHLSFNNVLFFHITEPEVKLPTSIESLKKQESSRKTSTFVYWLCQRLWLYGSQQTVENSETDENTRPPDCLLRNLYTRQETTVRTGHGTTDWFQIGRGVHQGCILSPCLSNLYAEYIMRNSGL